MTAEEHGDAREDQVVDDARLQEALDGQSSIDIEMVETARGKPGTMAPGASAMPSCDGIEQDGRPIASHGQAVTDSAAAHSRTTPSSPGRRRTPTRSAASTRYAR